MLRLEALYYYSLISARATTNFQNAAVPAAAGRFGVRELALALVALRKRKWSFAEHPCRGGLVSAAPKAVESESSVLLQTRYPCGVAAL